MRTALLVAIFLALASGAWADPNDLTAGCLVAHNVEQLPYSVDPPTGG